MTAKHLICLECGISAQRGVWNTTYAIDFGYCRHYLNNFLKKATEIVSVFCSIPWNIFDASIFVSNNSFILNGRGGFHVTHNNMQRKKKRKSNISK